MMAQITAGILMYRFSSGSLQLFLVHPGGPFWNNKEFEAWSIPKGLPEPGEEPISAAVRELGEETGCTAPELLVPLSPVMVKSGRKIIHAWAGEGDCDASEVKSNTFSLEWPPNSGKFREFPEVDRAAWFGVEEAKKRINKGQLRLIEELAEMLSREILKREKAGNGSYTPSE
jgi:predicted NUDIX family NTP pyrophosphohydrolase